MNKRQKFAGFIILAISCIYLGGVVGYFFGFFDGVTHGAIEGSTVVVSLRDLRTGKTKEAIRRIEGNLYGNVRQFAMFSDSRIKPFDILNLAGEKAALPWIGLIREYRNQYPESRPVPSGGSLTDHDKQLDLVDRTLSKYGQLVDKMRREHHKKDTEH